jgi:hypothetical protein
MEHSSPGVTTSEPEEKLRRSGGGVEDAALAARGDVHAFERLYRENAARILNLARRMMGPDTAEEITQDVFVRAWEKLGSFRGESAFEPGSTGWRSTSSSRSGRGWRCNARG